jgi:hypothetical protein
MMSRGGLRSAGPAHAVDELQSDHSRQVPIHDHQVRRPLGHGRGRRRRIGDRAHNEPGIGELLAQRLDCGNIPIDDEYLFLGIDGEHMGRAIRDTKLYSTLTLL